MPREPHLRGRGPFLPPLDHVVQYDFEPGYVVFTLPCPKRIRVMAGGETLADSANALILFESDHIPLYYVPVDAVRWDLFEPGKRRTTSPYKGDAEHWSLKGNPAYEDILWRYRDPVSGCPPIGDHVSFYWHEVDRWFEEDEEVFVHARDPFRRVDCLPSSRRVSVTFNGREIANSRRGVFLFETGLPTRHYLPLDDIDQTCLEPSDHRTQCPYKGEAHYYHVTVGEKRHKNLAWYYPEPVHEAARIKGLICLAGEYVDEVAVDGIAQPRPVTSFSKGYNYHGYK